MITTIITAAATIVVIGYFLLRDPKCPRCGWRMWEKTWLWPEMRCGWCGEWFDPTLPKLPPEFYQE